MRNPRHTGMIEYVLIAFIVAVAVLSLALALSPIISLILDGFKLIGALLAGDASTIGSLVGK